MPTKGQDVNFADAMQSSVKVSVNSLDKAISWIANELDPDDVFDEKKLSAWAENNGYKKEE